MSEIPSITIEQLREDFEFCFDQEDRQIYLIELGRMLPPLDESQKVDFNKVQGCLSQVWLVPRVGDDPKKLSFAGDSDGLIVKGLVAILIMLLSNKTPEEILAFDLKALFDDLGLKSALLQSRANGFYNMVQRVRDLATAAQNSP